MSNDRNPLQLDADSGDTLKITAADFIPVDTVIRLNLEDLDEIGTFKHKDPAYGDYHVVLCQPRSMRFQTCP